MTPNTYSAAEVLAPIASGLNFDSPDDRAVFRTRVADSFARYRVDYIRELCVELKASNPPATRVGACRELADMYMIREMSK